MDIDVKKLHEAKVALAAKCHTMEEPMKSYTELILQIAQTIITDISLSGECILEGERSNLS